MAPTIGLQITPTDLIVTMAFPDGRTEAYRHPREDAGLETYTVDGMVPTSELTRSIAVSYQTVDEILVQSTWRRGDRLVKDSRWVISKRAGVEAQSVLAQLG